MIFCRRVFAACLALAVSAVVFVVCVPRAYAAFSPNIWQNGNNCNHRNISAGGAVTGFTVKIPDGHEGFGSVQWSSADTAVARVSVSGGTASVSGVAQGATTLRAKITSSSGSVVEEFCTISVFEDVVNAKATVSKANTLVYMGASSSSWLKGVVAAGTPVTVRLVSGGWFRVAFADDYVFSGGRTDGNVDAWVRSSDLNIPVTGIRLNKAALSVVEGESGRLEAVLVPPYATNQSVSWSSLDSSVASVDSLGVVTGKRFDRSTTVSAVSADGGFSVSAVVDVSEVLATSVVLGRSSVSVGQGRTVRLDARVVPSNTSKPKVVWSSFDESVATVDQDGVVTGVQYGKSATIKAMVGGVSDTVRVTVTEVAATGISVSPSSAVVAVGEEIQLTPTLVPSDTSNPTVSYVSKNKAVAQVSGGGVVRGRKLGSTVVTAKAASGVSVKVNVRVVKKPSEPGVVDAAAKAKTPARLVVTPVARSLSVVDLGWNAQSAFFRGYEIWRTRWDSEGNQSEPKKVKTIKGSVKKWSDGGLKPHTKYSYKIKGIGKPGVKNKSSKKVTVRTGIALVGGLESSLLKTVKLSWSAMPKDFSGYEIWRTETGKKSVLVHKAKATTSKWTDTTTLYEAQYAYQVKAVPKSKRAKKVNKNLWVSNTVRFATPYPEKIRQQNKIAGDAIKDLLTTTLPNGETYTVLYQSVADLDKPLPGAPTDSLPYVKYLWTGQVLEIHVYIKYVNGGNFGEWREPLRDEDGRIVRDGNGNPTFSPNAEIHADRTFEQSVVLFEKGLKRFFDNKVISSEFGANGKFTTKLVIERESGIAIQKWIPVNIAPMGVDWYRATPILSLGFGHFDNGGVSMASDHAALYGEKEQFVEGDKYASVAAHETGHALGLNDAYTAFGVDRLNENTETSIWDAQYGGNNNLMKSQYSLDTILPNDLEMMLVAYREAFDESVKYLQSYKSYSDRKVSEAIKNCKDYNNNSMKKNEFMECER